VGLEGISVYDWEKIIVSMFRPMPFQAYGWRFATSAVNQMATRLPSHDFGEMLAGHLREAIVAIAGFIKEYSGVVATTSFTFGVFHSVILYGSVC
jgi:hypothetical protein